jgi:hypothetical protein
MGANVVVEDHNLVHSGQRASDVYAFEVCLPLNLQHSAA